MGFWRRLFGTPQASTGMPDEDSPLWARGTLDVALLTEWRWLIDTRFSPMMCTALGDLFLQGPGGAIYRLDVATGALLHAAASAEALDAAARDPDRFDAWWQPTLLFAAAKRTRSLGDNECYSWNKPPRFGGERNAENLAPRSLTEHFATLGSLFSTAR